MNKVKMKEKLLLLTFINLDVLKAEFIFRNFKLALVEAKSVKKRAIDATNDIEGRIQYYPLKCIPKITEQ